MLSGWFEIASASSVSCVVRNHSVNAYNRSPMPRTPPYSLVTTRPESRTVNPVKTL
jgi:hypothetical protein